MWYDLLKYDINLKEPKLHLEKLYFIWYKMELHNYTS